MINENELKTFIADDEARLAIAVEKMTDYEQRGETKVADAWEKEANRLATRLSAFALVLRGVRGED